MWPAPVDCWLTVGRLEGLRGGSFEELLNGAFKHSSVEMSEPCLRSDRAFDKRPERLRVSRWGGPPDAASSLAPLPPGCRDLGLGVVDMSEPGPHDHCLESFCLGPRGVHPAESSELCLRNSSAADNRPDRLLASRLGAVGGNPPSRALLSKPCLNMVLRVADESELCPHDGCLESLGLRVRGE